MTFHSLCFRAFVHATEDESKVVKALVFSTGGNHISRTESSGYHGNPITIFESCVKGRKNIDAFFRRVGGAILKELVRTAESRVDDACFFYLRLDKQEAYLENLVLSEKDDVIAVKGKIKSYPSRRSTAIESLTQYLTSFLP